MSFGSMGEHGTLAARKISPRRVHTLSVPKLGRVMFTRDAGSALRFAREHFQTHLHALHLGPDGEVKGKHDLGSGLTTQALALALANQGVSNTNANTLGQLKFMSSGTGTTAAAAADFQLQTQAGAVTTALVPTLAAVADNATMQWVGTIAYTSSLAITEWGLFAGAGTVGSQFNTAANAFTATTMTPTTSPAWTAHQWAGIYVCEVASATPVIGLITDNTATALTVSPSWATANGTGGVGTTPSSNTSATIFPLMGDHKVFAAINVLNGDSIQYTYTLTVNSGG